MGMLDDGGIIGPVDIPGVVPAPSPQVDIDYDKLKKEAKVSSRGFRVSMALTGLVAVTALALKVLFAAGVVAAFSLTPFGWAAMGLVAAAMLFIAIRRYKEGKIESEQSKQSIGNRVDPYESFKTEAKKGLWLLVPIYGWYRVKKEESGEGVSYAAAPKSPSSSLSGSSSSDSSGRSSPVDSGGGDNCGDNDNNASLDGLLTRDSSSDSLGEPLPCSTGQNANSLRDPSGNFLDESL